MCSSRAQAQAARDIQTKRFSNYSPDTVCNGDIRAREILQFCELPEDGLSLMQAVMSPLNLSARADHRILKLMCTIAARLGCKKVQSVRLAEALHHRPKLLVR